MTINKLPSQSELSKLFHYDPATGNLYRKIRVSKRTKVGEVVGCPDTKGYLQVWISGVQYRVHRVIWKMAKGIDPIQIDHINGVRDDNRIENLRSVSAQENRKNQKRRKDNTSGVIGVVWCKRDKRWYARIFVRGKGVHLGTFTKKQDAITVRKEAEIKYGYHENHGRI